MQIRPQKWTKHHTHRVLHVSGFVSVFLVLITLCWVFGTNLANIQAVDTVKPESVGVRVLGINEGPTTPVYTQDETTSGGSAANLQMPPQSPNIPPLQAPSVTVRAVPTEQMKVTAKPVTINGITQMEVVYNTQYPTFAGHTNIKNALIHLTVASKYTVTANVYADANGDWTWTPQVPLFPENHTLTVVATDELEPQITTTSVFYFAIVLPAGQTIETPTANNIVQKGNGGNLFDVIVGIPLQFKTIAPGDEVVAKVKFVNYGKPGHSVDVEAQYVIRDSENNIVMQSSQTVAVATQLSILKTFYTNSAMPPGRYTITVSVPSEDLVATATDTFDLKQKITTAGSTNMPINYTVTFQILAGMILLFSLVLYLEYNKVEVLSMSIKQITEEDLINQV